MKKQLLLLLITIYSTVSIASPRIGDYRTISDGAWNKFSNWEFFNGKKWINAIVSPDDKNGEITIRSGTNITITDNLNADQLIVEEGGHLWIAHDHVLNIFNGKGTDLFINGTLCVNGILNESEKSNMTIAGLVLIQREGSHEFSQGSSLTILNEGKIRYGEIGTNELAFTDPYNKSSLIRFSPGVFTEMNMPVSQKNNSMQSISLQSKNLPSGKFIEEETSSDKFENFQATMEGDKILLNWNMEFNTENRNCRIERSQDGINFNEIVCSIEFQKYKDKYYFTANDEHPNQGDNIYRIKQISRDYKKFYSEVVKVNFDSPVEVNGELKIISIIKNPFTKNYELNFFVPHGGTIDLALLNSSGKRICYDKISVKDGYNSYEFFRPLSKRVISFATLSRNNEMVLEKVQKD